MSVCLRTTDIERKFPFVFVNALEGTVTLREDVVRVSRLREVLNDYRELLLHRAYYTMEDELTQRFGVLLKEKES